MLGKILIFLIGTTVGVAVTYYNKWIVKNFGMIGWAEKIFGNAGTYLMYQLAGVLIIVGTLLYIFNGFDSLGNWMVGFFKK